MDVILIPGFWLDASSWDPVLPALRAAGHEPHPLTLPGLERDADRSSVSLRDQVEHTLAVVDACEGPVVVVGHSGGGAIAHAVADARPDRVARVVYVDAVPVGHGDNVNDGLPVVDGEIPLPDWSAFDDEDLVDLDDALRAEFRARAVPIPAGMARDAVVLSDERRYDVPATVIACEYPSTMLREMVGQGAGYTAELGRIKDVTYVDLPTGHWPQLTKPAELAAVLVAAI